MIISASYKTDIPTFYGPWFRNRLQAGFCRMVNPYNAHQHFKVSLKPEDVDGFIFWTKNVGPFLGVLDLVRERQQPFIVQHTINGYPRALESRVIDADRSVDHLRQVAEKFGPKVAVWRYDTIIFSTLTPPDFHRKNFERLARQLEGSTDEVVVSFMQVYKKTDRNMNQAGEEHGFAWSDPPTTDKLGLLSDLVDLARSRGMKLTMCSQPEHVADGVGIARCVDADRLRQIGGREFRAVLQGGREACGCFKSKDIGDYDTCPHGCVYCYAVRNRALALRRHGEHDPDGEYLFPVPAPKERGSDQLTLLPGDGE